MSCEFATKSLDYGSTNPKAPVKGIHVKGRLCQIDMLICHHYDKPDMVKLCPTRGKIK